MLPGCAESPLTPSRAAMNPLRRERFVRVAGCEKRAGEGMTSCGKDRVNNFGKCEKPAASGTKPIRP